MGYDRRVKPGAVLSTVIALLASSTPCFGDGKFLGNWGDRNGANLYAFQANGAFEFQRRKPDPAGDNATTVEGKGEPASYERVAGVWTSGKAICSSGLQKGDLILYVDEMQCCMMVQLVADKLVLSAVFTRGKDDLSLCRNRVLSRMEALPGGGTR